MGGVTQQRKEVMHMKISHLAAAAALTGFIGFGGVSLASAQTDPSTTTTTPSTTTAPDAGTPAPDGRAHDPANCPNMGGDSSSTDSSSTTANSGL
jgi:hypothetical protein